MCSLFMCTLCIVLAYLIYFQSTGDVLKCFWTCCIYQFFSLLPLVNSINISQCHTCDIIPTYFRHSCDILPTYFRHTSDILATYLRHTSDILDERQSNVDSHIFNIITVCIENGYWNICGLEVDINIHVDVVVDIVDI